jgi:hypothetical protein
MDQVKVRNFHLGPFLIQLGADSKLLILFFCPPLPGVALNLSCSTKRADIPERSLKQSIQSFHFDASPGLQTLTAPF